MPVTGDPPVETTPGDDIESFPIQQPDPDDGIVTSNAENNERLAQRRHEETGGRLADPGELRTPGREPLGEWIYPDQPECPEQVDGLRILAITEDGAFPLPTDLDGFHTVIQQWAWDRGANWAFEPMNPEDESPLPESTHPLGFHVTFVGSAAHPKALSKLSIRAGGDGVLPNALLIMFPPGDANRGLDLQ